MKHCFLIALFALASFAFTVCADEAGALKVLSSDDATLEQKANACDELGRVGTAKAVPVLAALLSDKQLHDYARDGLERIPDAAAGQALVDALSELKGKHRAGVVISLGDRGDASAVAALAGLAKAGTPPHLAAAALTSLAQIGDEQALGTVLSALDSGDKAQKAAAAQAVLAAAMALEEKAARLRKKVANADVAEHLKAAAAK